MSRQQEGSYAEECERAVVPPDGFSKALRKGNLEQVRRFLQINSSLVNTKILDGVEGSENCGREFTPLVHAIREHHGSGRNILELVEMVRVLLDYKPDINAQNNEGWTALHYAAASGFVRVVELLLQYHADVNVRDIYGWSPFLLSAGNAEIVRLLMDNGADVTRTNHKGYPDWLLAIDHCNVTTFKLLLTEHYVGDLDLSAKWGEDGWSAVHRAAAYGTLETLEYLLDHARVDVNARTTNGKTPLHYAVLGHYPEPPRVQLLLRRGANVNAADHDGDTAFALVCRKALDSDDTTQVAELLIDHGADIHRWGDGKEPLLDAVSQGYNANLSLVELILKQEEMDLNAKASDGSADTLAFQILDILIVHARIADRRHRQIFMLLIEHGADVKAKHQQSGRTLLHFAAFAKCKGDGELESEGRWLLKKGSHIDAVDKQGWTPLLYACLCGHWNIARMLVDHGADVNIAAVGNEATPLLLVCQKNEERMAQLLLGAGAQVDYRLKDGVTALLTCVLNGSVECAILLLERGADIHAWDNRTGNTPFFRACQRGKLDMIYCLIRLSPHDRRLGLLNS